MQKSGKSLKATVLVFPGSNCDAEAFAALENLGFQTSYTWHRESLPSNLDLCFVPGGFSYGDYLRSGAIAAMSSILSEVKTFAEKGGMSLVFVTDSKFLPKQKFLMEHCYAMRPLRLFVKLLV
jgi:phosphoribosylformylglycinamidine (FGAM) synthase-like amidotransferase family enzyme